MKGKKITSLNPLIGAVGAIEMMADSVMGKDVSGRATAMREELEGITIDTCAPADTGVWETGILREKVEGEWVIVSQYETDQEAKEGHAKWVKLMKDNPTCKLKDIDMWNLGIND